MCSIPLFLPTVGQRKGFAQLYFNSTKHDAESLNELAKKFYARYTCEGYSDADNQEGAYIFNFFLLKSVKATKDATELNLLTAQYVTHLLD